MIKYSLIMACTFFFCVDGSFWHKRTRTHEKKAASRTYRTKNSTTCSYKLKIDAVECEQCAKLVVEILKQYDGIQNPCFIMTGKYSEVFFEFTWEKVNTNIPFESIQEQLKKNGFALSWLEGYFCGSVAHDNSKALLLVADGAHDPILLKNAPAHWETKKQCVVAGTLRRENKHGCDRYVIALS